MQTITDESLRYLKLLSKQYPNIASASTEIINLKAILNLPKGTEHFLSDIHGEYEAFSHVLRNGSGSIRRKIDDVFGNTLSIKEKRTLATLIYYPEQKLALILKNEDNIEDWYKITLYRLIEVCRVCSLKYTRSKVRKALPKDFSYILEELLHEQREGEDKKAYYEAIIHSIIELDRAREFIIALSKLIQRLVIDRLHIIGDIYDRGPRADMIMDTLEEYHAVDIQWGNHDILWMAAAAGSGACIANVMRISARYANLDIIEDGYGINLFPLAVFASQIYADDPCLNFIPKMSSNNPCSSEEIQFISKMHKAITIIQFKLEGQIIKRRSEFDMNHRLLLDKINYKDGTIEIEGVKYKLNDKSFPTIDPKNPYKLTPEENEIVEKLIISFRNSEKLQRHTTFLFSKGSIYLTHNSNLLYHGCIPMNEDGTFSSMKLQGQGYAGKQLLDEFDRLARQGYRNSHKESKQYGEDIMWYLWTGSNSSLFGKEKMTTFERYFIDDKKAHIEPKNPYYELVKQEQVCNQILREFGLSGENSHIINGHVPVERKSGESPIKANGKLFVIDGGFCKAYQAKTGIAGYTLVYNSYGMILVSHKPFESTESAIESEIDILSSYQVLEKVIERKRVGDTDIGEELSSQIKDLECLVRAYRKGLITERC